LDVAKPAKSQTTFSCESKRKNERKAQQKNKTMRISKITVQLSHCILFLQMTQTSLLLSDHFLIIIIIIILSSSSSS
jgi:hypothetical protein